MYWIILILLHIAVAGTWYWLSTLPNCGTGGLGDVVLPMLFTALVIIIDLIVIIYQIYKQIFSQE